ncbi:terminase small subunit [Roseobacter weihaiensis]|uniref:terminase small subunit n=1 Tax=Roseobacter weihaiensis TaxID=2763262 RepID=UPI001D0ABC84|nr:terminase small subunit [Roseobacter sp. H9]
MSDEIKSDLRSLTAAEADLVSRYPLPDGVPDALVNKTQLETALGVSGVTMAAWIRKGLPCEQEGTNGRAWQFRLSVAFAWNAARQAEDRARDAEAEAASQQLALALVGEGGLGANAGLSLAEQRQILELEHVHAVAARDRGELIRRPEVVEGFEVVFAAIRDALDALPDRLAREIGVEGRDLERIETACDDVLAAAARKVTAIIGEVDLEHDKGTLSG